MPHVILELSEAEYDKFLKYYNKVSHYLIEPVRRVPSKREVYNRVFMIGLKSVMKD